MEFGGDLTIAQVEDLVEQRYLLPRERRIWWAQLTSQILAGKKPLSDGHHLPLVSTEETAPPRAVALEDPELWAQYAQPYGAAVGHWRLHSDRLGAMAKAGHEGLTWGQLAHARGLPWVLVPAGGVHEDATHVLAVVDSRKLLALESASKAAGEPHTLGAETMPPRPEPPVAEPAPVTTALVETSPPVPTDSPSENWHPATIAKCACLDASALSQLFDYAHALILDWEEDLAEGLLSFGPGRLQFDPSCALIWHLFWPTSNTSVQAEQATLQILSKLGGKALADLYEAALAEERAL
jgi:hypothetical protein